MNSFDAFSSVSVSLWSLAVLILTVFTSDPYLAAVSLLCALVNLWAFRLLNGGRVLILPTLFILLCTVSNPLFSSRGATELLFINDLPITLESLVFGATTGTLLGAATLHCILLYNLLDDSRLLELLGKRAAKTALVLSSAMHFLPELRRRFSEISDAQRAIGRLPDNGVRRRIGGSIRVWSALLSLSFEDAAAQSVLMRSRGLSETSVRRTPASMHKRSASKSVILMSLTLVLFSVSIMGIALGITETALIPRIVMPRTAACIPVYISCTLLMLIPSFIKLKGDSHGRS